jgi:UDPglucose 6-dehydrogenase/UDP-N-acetyl-D-galactosamine dehydrogenase
MESPGEEMVEELKEFKVDVYGYDPPLDARTIEHFGAKPVKKLKRTSRWTRLSSL